MENDYLEINRKQWNSRTEIHYDSEFYGVKEFLAGENCLKQIELDLLDDIRNKKILHLQCHFGLDTLSLERLGARPTGIDLSDRAIARAKELATKAGMKSRFIESDVYSLPQVLDEKFNIVFTSYGTIGWLPDLDQWAKVVQHYLNSGGIFVMADFHPVVWMYSDDFSKIEFDYFNTEAIVELQKGTYSDRNAPIENLSVGWNHPISEILTALISNGMEITHFQEFDYSPYNCFQNTKEIEPGKFIIETFDKRIPMVYAIRAMKK